MNEDRVNEPQDQNPYQAQPAPKKSSFCCLWGCLAMVLLVALVVVGGGLSGYWWLQGQVNRYTSETAADLPIVELPEEDLAEIEARVDTFKETIEAGGTPEDLVLTTEELNALITKDENLRGKVYVTIDDGVVSGDVSIPADAFPGGKGRFFNASATFNVSLENGVLIVTLADAEVKGEKLPQQFIDGMSKENLAKDIYKDPEVAATLRRIESISIEHDKIILKPRLAANAEEGSDAPTADEKTPNGNADAAESQSPPTESDDPQAPSLAEPETTSEAK